MGMYFPASGEITVPLSFLLSFVKQAFVMWYWWLTKHKELEGSAHLFVSSSLVWPISLLLGQVWQDSLPLQWGSGAVPQQSLRESNAAKFCHLCLIKTLGWWHYTASGYAQGTLNFQPGLSTEENIVVLWRQVLKQHITNCCQFDRFSDTAWKWWNRVKPWLKTMLQIHMEWSECRNIVWLAEESHQLKLLVVSSCQVLHSM